MISIICSSEPRISYTSSRNAIPLTFDKSGFLATPPPGEHDMPDRSSNHASTAQTRERGAIPRPHHGHSGSGLQWDAPPATGCGIPGSIRNHAPSCLHPSADWLSNGRRGRRDQCLRFSNRYNPDFPGQTRSISPSPSMSRRAICSPVPAVPRAKSLSAQRSFAWGGAFSAGLPR